MVMDIDRINRGLQETIDKLALVQKKKLDYDKGFVDFLLEKGYEGVFKRVEQKEVIEDFIFDRVIVDIDDRYDKEAHSLLKTYMQNIGDDIYNIDEQRNDIVTELKVLKAKALCLSEYKPLTSRDDHTGRLYIVDHGPYMGFVNKDYPEQIQIFECLDSSDPIEKILHKSEEEASFDKALWLVTNPVQALHIYSICSYLLETLNQPKYPDKEIFPFMGRMVN